MKYLFAAALLVLSTSAQVEYPGQSYNDDVTRKITLTNEALVDIATDVRFKPLNVGDDYFYVIPSANHDHLVMMTAVVSNT